MTELPGRVVESARSRVSEAFLLADSVPRRDFTVLVATGIIALRPLAFSWRADPNYAFGWGVPLLAVYLFYATWPERPERHPPCASRLGLVLVTLGWSFVFLVARMLVETVPDWRPSLWMEASVYVGGVVAWCWLYGGRDWAGHFFFPVAFLLLGVPWLYNLELPLVQELMRFDAARVADTLVLFDLPASAAGNTVILTSGQLDIEQACSGVRSLQAGVMMALFLGEFYSFSVKRRGLLALFAVFLALAGNYLRLLVLAEIAIRHGISAVVAMHDFAADGIFAFSLLGLWAACLAPRNLRQRSMIADRALRSARAQVQRPNCAAIFWAAGLLLAVLIGEAATQSWFAWREKSAPPSASWSVRLPDRLPGFRAIAISAATHELLHDQQSQTGTWRDRDGWLWQALWFRYPPEPASRIAADTHNPEICLAGAGLRQTTDFGAFTVTNGNLSLPVRAYLFSSDTQSEYVFWIASLDRPVSSDPVLSQQEIIHGQTMGAFLDRVVFLGRNAWLGIRASGAQTLELSIVGAPSYAAARAGFIGFAKTALVLDSPAVPSRR